MQILRCVCTFKQKDRLIGFHRLLLVFVAQPTMTIISERMNKRIARKIVGFCRPTNHDGFIDQKEGKNKTNEETDKQANGRTNRAGSRSNSLQLPLDSIFL